MAELRGWSVTWNQVGDLCLAVYPRSQYQVQSYSVSSFTMWMKWQYILSEFIDDKKLRGMADATGGWSAIQRDHNTLDKLTNRNLMKLSMEKCKVLHLERNNPMYQYMLEDKQMQNSFAEKDLVSWWTSANNVPLLQRWLMGSLAALAEVLPAGWGQWSFFSV